MNHMNPERDGYYLIFLPQGKFTAARQVLQQVGITLDPLNFAEVGHRSETHCSLMVADSLIRETVNEALSEQNLRVKEDLNWEQLRQIAEHYANDRSWTGDYEVQPHAFRAKFPHFLSPANGE